MFTPGELIVIAAFIAPLGLALIASILTLGPLCIMREIKMGAISFYCYVSYGRDGLQMLAHGRMLSTPLAQVAASPLVPATPFVTPATI